MSGKCIATFTGTATKFYQPRHYSSPLRDREALILFIELHFDSNRAFVLRQGWQMGREAGCEQHA
jgi:hypothetical protein